MIDYVLQFNPSIYVDVRCTCTLTSYSNDAHIGVHLRGAQGAGEEGCHGRISLQYVRCAGWGGLFAKKPSVSRVIRPQSPVNSTCGVLFSVETLQKDDYYIISKESTRVRTAL